MHKLYNLDKAKSKFFTNSITCNLMSVKNRHFNIIKYRKLYIHVNETKAKFHIHTVNQSKKM